MRDTFEALRNQDNRAPLSVADLPQALRDRFVGVTGKYLLMVYPKRRRLEARESKRSSLTRWGRSIRT